MKNRLTAFALGLCWLVGAPGMAAAQDQISLRLGGMVPPTHFVGAHGTKVFMDEMAARTGGKVQFQYFPSEQLAKSTELMNSVQLGVVDVGEIVPGYFADKLPLSGIIEMPGLAEGSCAASAAFRTISEPGTPLYDSEYKTANIRVLSYMVFPPYSIDGTRPLKSMQDFKGAKIRVAGPGMELAVAKLGAVGIKIPAGEIYDAVARGTVDAATLAFMAFVDYYGLHEVAKYSLTGYPLGSASMFLAISEKKFQSLPADVQQAMIEAGKVAEKSACEFMDKEEAAAMERAIQAGVEVTQVSDEMRAEMDALLAPVAADWAANLDKQGRPGTETLNAYRAALGK
ncbi:TRAP transporter substrate-binding protein DctP [Paracoccus sp. N5]|uniref:TRAP transporter substrate-binding protein n=1 Tax=Paracoccus sp. N5 TaxID=1101189 RepID=UPI0003A01580|nr:TRAP transporter substrate-binding protein DctP [Paracoccus sp. N5]